ncbi:MAG: hypothetical protein ACI8WB_000760 [Phenylobacterium sp.]|jgi:hypothetical protein
MKKYLTLLMLIFSFHATTDTDVTVFGQRFNTSEYFLGQWYGPMDFSDLPSLAELGVERYDVINITLNTARFNKMLNAIGFIKTEQIQQEIPAVITLYSDQLLMDNPQMSFDGDTVNVLSVYTLDNLKYGSTIHRFYEPKQSLHQSPHQAKLKPIEEMTFKTQDNPECSTVFEFGLHWLADENAPQHVTVLVINNVEIIPQIESTSQQFGDFRQIIKKVKLIDKKGVKKRKQNNG